MSTLVRFALFALALTAGCTPEVIINEASGVSPDEVKKQVDSARCEAAIGCWKEGLCSPADDGECSALTAKDCRRARVACALEGRCTARDGVCLATKNSDCKASLGCRVDGLCTASGGGCRAESNADCKDTHACGARCTASSGVCAVRAPGADPGGSAVTRLDVLGFSKDYRIALVDTDEELRASALMWVDTVKGKATKHVPYETRAARAAQIKEWRWKFKHPAERGATAPAGELALLGAPRLAAFDILVLKGERLGRLVRLPRSRKGKGAQLDGVFWTADGEHVAVVITEKQTDDLPLRRDLHVIHLDGLPIRWLDP